MDDLFLEMIYNANNPEAKLASIVTELKWYFIDIKLIATPTEVLKHRPTRGHLK